MSIVITGAGGRLGLAMVREFTDARVLDREDLDITDAAAVRKAISPADTVINCAAFTDVDLSETECRTAFEANALGPMLLAQQASKVVHFGTDFAFDGRSRTPYHECARVNPLSFYAQTKSLGEDPVLRQGGVVLRIGSLFSDDGGGLTNMVLRLRSGGCVEALTDRTVTPAYAPDVAKAVRQVLGMPPGLYHYANVPATWFELATEAARLVGRGKVVPATMDKMGWVAPRPRYSALASGSTLRWVPWREALARHVGGMR